MTLLWLCFGMVILFSASYPVAEADFNDGARYFKVQLIWIVVGLFISRWITRHPLQSIMRLSGFFLLVSMLMVMATHIPGVGISVNGATRWLPFGPFLIQPSELMKPFLVMHSAQLFGKWHQLSNSTRLVWLGIFTGGLLLILAQPNLSTTAVCGISIWLIAFAAGLPYRQLMLTAGTGVVAAVLSVSIKSYQRDRIISFLNPWADPSDSGFQLIQSMLAIGSGGVGGTGYGLSAQKLYFLPIQYTDFIFSVFAEEFGFIGGMMLLLFLAVYSTVALMVAIQAKKTVHRLVAIGCMVLLVGQSLVNMGVASGVLPTTGLPFPLISYGGSSMIASLITAGVLIRVARESRDAEVLTLPRIENNPDRSAKRQAEGQKRFGSSVSELRKQSKAAPKKDRAVHNVGQKPLSSFRKLRTSGGRASRPEQQLEQQPEEQVKEQPEQAIASGSEAVSEK